MPQPNPCRICEESDERRAEIEALGLRAAAGELSWRAATREAGLPYHQPLINHMDKHYVSDAQRLERKVDDDLAVEIEKTSLELLAQMRIAPLEVRPLYATAIKNLRELADTKASQQHLIQSLKAISEITGMKMEQQMMVAFAGQMFGGQIGPATHDPVRELEAGNAVIEAEVLEDV